MGKVVRLHDGLRALYPDAIVFGCIGTSDAVREFDRIRALLGQSPVADDQSALTVAVTGDGLSVWAESPVLSLRPSHLAAVGIDEGALDVTAVVGGRTAAFAVPLAVPAEAPHIADRIFAALSGTRTA